MTTQQKEQIQKLLNGYCSQFGSQAKAAQSLTKVGEATVINIRKGKWDNISDEMWLNVGKQIGFSMKGNGWVIVPTKDFKKLTTLYNDARDYSLVYFICGNEGSGKTEAAKEFNKNNPNVYHLKCSEYFNRKVFLSRLLKTMGKNNTGSVSDMMDLIIETCLRQDSPIIILDEADKLPDQILFFFITLYNELQDKCAIILQGTEYLATRIERGRKLGKKGFAEIFSRGGRKFIYLNGTDKAEIAQICIANGVANPKVHDDVLKQYEKDLRRLKVLVHAEHRRNARLAA